MLTLAVYRVYYSNGNKINLFPACEAILIVVDFAVVLAFFPYFPQLSYALKNPV